MDNYHATIEKAISSSGSNRRKIIKCIDTTLYPTPIVIGIESDSKLFMCSIKTKEWFGYTRYDDVGRFIYLIDNLYLDGIKPDKLIDDNYVYHDDENFSRFWFGIIYPDKRDKIKINNKTPILNDIHFDGVDYIFWYIEKDGEEAVLSFE